MSESQLAYVVQNFTTYKFLADEKAHPCEMYTKYLRNARIFNTEAEALNFTRQEEKTRKIHKVLRWELK